MYQTKLWKYNFDKLTLLILLIVFWQDNLLSIRLIHFFKVKVENILIKKNDNTDKVK